MEHGESLDIEEIQVGDYVQSMDVDSNKSVSKTVFWVQKCYIYSKIQKQNHAV